MFQVINDFHNAQMNYTNTCSKFEQKRQKPKKGEYRANLLDFTDQEYIYGGENSEICILGARPKILRKAIQRKIKTTVTRFVRSVKESYSKKSKKI